ncbi:hypothetical protein HFP51_08220 [Parasphingopyxis sp. CP4]|uniref:hypothetical protein n=1 Tax=Parasphingopyxis sp. CP4 TaxID=2724527 RepID=UPI0015A4B028|nr:hypothetical protein [Parasphingopyxis sp. CP4]QLC22162.1 hypothetical protein HFP51_08220 [Parasphingopyxis sp. CP4]
MQKLTAIFAATLIACGINSAASAQSASPPIIYQPDQDSPIGARNPEAPEQTQELSFLIGDWDVALIIHPLEGEDISYAARWHNSWIVNGYAVMQEWRGPYATGVELRSFNPETGRWEGHNYYTFRKTWTESSGEFVDGEFIIETRDVGPNGPFIGRERYFEIQPDSFRMSATRSEDDGATWSSITYEMLCTRARE